MHPQQRFFSLSLLFCRERRGAPKKRGRKGQGGFSRVQAMEGKSNHPSSSFSDAEALLQTIDYKASLRDPKENAIKLKRYEVITFNKLVSNRSICLFTKAFFSSLQSNSGRRIDQKPAAGDTG